MAAWPNTLCSIIRILDVQIVTGYFGGHVFVLDSKSCSSQMKTVAARGLSLAN